MISAKRLKLPDVINGDLDLSSLESVDGIMFDLKAQGYVFSFSKKGGKATNGQAAWWYLAK